MKKRIVCALLTLILLLGLVPATALTASAASLSTSEAAITVLKQLESFSSTCNAKGYIGYHTKCTQKGDHGVAKKPHTIGQAAADKALREELATLDKAINSFASNNGLSLTQNKHDALVLFSFRNGTSWTSGAGDFRAAVINGKKGDDFLNAILNWNGEDTTRRKVEANMYLNGIYSITAPTNFIKVTYNANGGTLNGATTRDYYYDASANPQPHLVPTRDGYTFTGWYCDDKLVSSLTTAFNGKTLTARWMDNKNSPDSAEETVVKYKVALTQLVSQNVYKHKLDDGKYTFSLAKDSKDNVIQAKTYATDGYLNISKEYIDGDGTKWGIIKGVSLWVKLPGSTTSSTTTTVNNSIDVTVKVTNSYVNRRADASIYANKTGSYDLGASLRIIDTESNDGFLWGKVAQNTTGTESVGWVALMYTNYDTVRNQTSNSFTTGSVIATGFITYNGYVNVRSNAGTVNPIVGSLYKGTQVSIYETKYVNGLEWGRTDTGWFCMSYANVTRLTEEKVNGSDVNYISYVFTGTTRWDSAVYDAPNGNELTDPVKGQTAVTITAFAEDNNGYTLGKTSQGWLYISDAKGTPQDVKLDAAKFTVVNEVTVRDNPGNNSNRVNTLSKNVSFQVNNGSYQVVVTGENLWGYASVLDDGTSGWINLSNKYVKRDDAPTVESTATATGKIATIVGADTVRVRGDSTLSGKLLGTISQGTQVNILDERNGWYKIDYKCTDEEGVDSWVYGQYVQVSVGTVSSGSASSTDGIGVGIIANTGSGVNLRATPGTDGALKGKILAGTQVNILETRTVGTSKWGRVENGWICMDYVRIISDLPADVLAALGASGTTGSGSTTTGAEVAMYTGTTTTKVTVYAEPDKKSTEIRELNPDEKVTVHEIRTVVTSEDGKTTKPDGDGSTTTTVKNTTTYWARVNDGYIINPATNLTLDTLDEAVYTVTETDTLNVREGAGTGNAKVFNLLKGDQVKVTNVKIIDGSVWGNIECDEGTGWASLAYMTKGAVATNNGNANSGTTGTTGTTTGTTGTVTGSTGNTGAVSASGYIYTGKVINTDSVRIRNTASTLASVSTTLNKGAALVIYETCISEGMAWGRCDAGWVYLYYVDMTPVNGSGAVDARVVYNDNTIIYGDKDCSSTVGTYAKMAVIDIYEIVGKMARTDLGWVNTDNLLS